MINMQSKIIKLLPYFMWMLPLLFFAHQFILRLWPSLMATQIMEQYSINATKFGMLSAFYYYGYASMQIPVAILLEKFGAKRIICTFAILCGFAAFLFIWSNHFYLALFSRFLIGAGSAVGFLGVSKVITDWFPQKQYARMVGLSFSVGLLGAIYAGKPLTFLLDHYQWKSIGFAIAFIAIAIGLAVFFCLKTKPIESTIKAENHYSLKSFKSILSSPLIWLLAVSNLLMVGSLEGFADVWGVPYLTTSFPINKSTAAGLISFVFFGMLSGGPVLATLSKKFGYYAIISFAGFALSALFITLLSTHFYSWYLLAGIFFIIGNLCCYQVIVFSAGAQLVPTQVLGVTIAFLNCMNMLGGSLFHSVIGRVMDVFWQGAIDTNGVRIYQVLAYHKALSVIPICASLGAILIIFLAILRHKAKKNLGKTVILQNTNQNSSVN